jgi:formate-dependent nitrite reductase membrane component NrfD
LNAGETDLRSLNPDNAAFGVGDGAMLPPHASPTYYDQPLLKQAHWGWNVIAYLFIGGIMGGTGMLAAVADESGEDAPLARNAIYLAFVLACASPLLLIGHLGRPERFLHMLRIFKFKSAMSMGVWGLVAFSNVAVAGVAEQLARDSVLPKWIGAIFPRGLTRPLLGVVGSFISGYTGVLLSSTAIPLWGIGKRYIPAASVCSGLAGACAANAALLSLGGGPARTVRKLERLELVASLAEGVLLLDFKKHAGELGAPMYEGPRGRKFAVVTGLCGIAVPAVLNALPFHTRWKTVLAAALTLAGGYVFRETLIEAGKGSADDPRAASRQPE